MVYLLNIIYHICEVLFLNKQPYLDMAWNVFIDGFPMQFLGKYIAFRLQLKSVMCTFRMGIPSTEVCKFPPRKTEFACKSSHYNYNNFLPLPPLFLNSASHCAKCQVFLFPPRQASLKETTTEESHVR